MRNLSFAVLALSAVSLAQSPDLVAPALKARAIGPTTMSGRISAIAVYESDPRIVYVASASGGLWRTDNGGANVRPVFDREKVVSLGAVAVSAKSPDVVWVGTGEQTSRNSVAWGDGVYKSLDGGKTWTNMGLRASKHVGAIWIDPKDDDHVLVGALGPLWADGGERGLFETRDGGKKWNQILKGQDGAGVIDLDVDPGRPGTMIVSLWSRKRAPYDFVSGGPGCMMMKTTDGGRTWRRLVRGIPATTLGRIGVDRFHGDARKLVATIEYKPLPSEKRPVEGGVVKTKAGGTFLSEDGGESWKKINDLNPRPFYFSTPRVDVKDPSRMWVLGDSLFASTDGGAKFAPVRNSVHPDWHAWWQSPKDPNLIYAGTDGGLYISRDGTKTWQHCQDLPVGQFYAVAADMRRPYWVLGGLQDNQCWIQPTQTPQSGPDYSSTISLGGGDGFYVGADPTDWSTVYSESQGGAVVRTDLRSGAVKGIRPRLAGEKLRFNWSTPFMLSPHNSRTLYLGGNRLFKSVDRGDTWRPISPDLTTNDLTKQKPGEKSVTPEDTGAEAHCTIVTISESPRRPGALMVGTDDGKVHLSTDDGANWEDLTSRFPGLPANTWCSRVVLSKHSESRAWATFDGHRWGDTAAYAYVTDDSGKSWSRLSGLPADDSVYVVREGLQNPDLLFLGTETVLALSLDRGKTWGRITNGFPTVAVHDLMIHPKELDLIIGTHGRSLYTVDVSALEAMTPEKMKAPVVIARPQDVLMLGRVDQGDWSGTRPFQAENTQPGTRIQYFLANEPKELELSVSNVAGDAQIVRTATKAKGLNVVNFNGRVSGRLAPGEYKVTLKVDGTVYATTLRVEDVSPKN